MSLKLLYGTVCAFLVVFLFHSCQKEYSCENCKEANRPPIARAGLDEKLVLPRDSVLLDGSASHDPDGRITAYRWTRIAGPVTFSIVPPDSAKTLIGSLAIGVYQFLLTVTDNDGLSATDTVKVTVTAAGAVNRPPVACAGNDIVITLPAHSVNLDGACSTDPDNNIATYLWSKIAGPASHTIKNPNAAQTPASNLTEGIYQFELKVTDDEGLSSKDTMRVTVHAVVPYTCGNTNRPRIQAKLMEVGRLTSPRIGMAVASTGSKVLFASGYTPHCFGCGGYSTRVDIYDMTTQTWSTAELSSGRYEIAAVAAGNKIFFAGGDAGDGTTPMDHVDVYDASANSWSLMHLSRKAFGIAAAAVGNKVLFAGGYGYREVDILDLTTNTWSTTTLSSAMGGATAVTLNNKVYFGGNCKEGIIIYDNHTNTWSKTPLKESRSYVAGINVGNTIYWAGGNDCSGTYIYDYCSVEVQDVHSGTITLQNLSGPKGFWTNGGQNAVSKDNKLIFYKSNMTSPYDPSSVGTFDMYDTATGTWSIGVFPFPLEDASIISVNNTVYVAGGLINGVFSDKVWKLEF